MRIVCSWQCLTTHAAPSKQVSQQVQDPLQRLLSRCVTCAEAGCLSWILQGWLYVFDSVLIFDANLLAVNRLQCIIPLKVIPVCCGVMTQSQCMTCSAHMQQITASAC